MKANRLSAHACATVSPAVTAAAPKASPARPTAIPTPNPSLIAEERVVVSMGNELMFGFPTPVLRVRLHRYAKKGTPFA
ncbi:hypothetical protein GCM10010517_03730 [Streptosporangium fragile]|uniref:Uncharacterized protein n=1 Tax=Streptosporangium fragile TaxID=46186 RepID=A0ABN3VPF4_9ACTN